MPRFIHNMLKSNVIKNNILTMRNWYSKHNKLTKEIHKSLIEFEKYYTKDHNIYFMDSQPNINKRYLQKYKNDK
jgi:hypothetical protein